MKPKVPLNIQLIITEQCNLRCDYCFEIDKGPKSMPVGLAKEIINRELSQQSEYDEFQIDLAGGEPFLHFNDLREIVDYSIQNSSRWNKKFYFFICSNLTLLDEKIKTWLEERRDYVVLGTSLDGTKKIHDHYRCNSYDIVVHQIPFYRKLYPLQGVKMTIGPDGIESIYEGIISIESLGLAPSANVVYEPVWGDSKSKKDHLRHFAEQLDLLIPHYIDNPDLEVPNLLSLPIRNIIMLRDPSYRWCGSGRTMTAYDTDGRKLPCHRFSRFCTGKLFEGPQSIGPRVETKCDSCVLAAACPNCPGYNWQVYGHPDSRTSYHCEFIKLQFLAAAKLIFLRNESLIAQLVNSETKNVPNVPKNTLESILAAEFVMQSLDVEDIISHA